MAMLLIWPGSYLIELSFAKISEDLPVRNPPHSRNGRVCCLHSSDYFKPDRLYVRTGSLHAMGTFLLYHRNTMARTVVYFHHFSGGHTMKKECVCVYLCAALAWGFIVSALMLNP